MTAATLLTGLYPPAVRERWGAEISREVSAAGVRCWPDTVAGAVRLWLRPGDWPETHPGQTRRVLTVTLFALAAAAALALRSVAPSSVLTADVRHPGTSLWLAPLLLGIALAAPLPALRGGALVRAAGEAVRTLAAPCVAFLALAGAAWSGALAHPPAVADAALVASYWLVLGFFAYRLCVLVARVARGAAPPPSTRRLSAALLLTGAGLALAAGQSLLAVALHPYALALGLPAAVALRTGRELRRLSPTAPPPATASGPPPP